MDALIRDITHSLRALVRMPILATVVVLSLAVGIGVNTAVFSWIEAVVFRPVPGVAHASSIYIVEPKTETGIRPGSSWLEYRDLQQHVPTVPELAAFRMVPLNIGETSRSERGYALLVSGNYFVSLGLKPAAGRFLLPDEASRPGGQPVIVISYDYWRDHFGLRADAIGATLRVNDNDLTVVGVTPDGFQGTVLGLQFDLWVPATMAPVLLAGSRELEDRAMRGYTLMGRLAPSATLAGAQVEVADAMRTLAARYPESSQAISADVVPFWRATRGPQTFLLQAMLTLQAVMLMLLLAVCGNTANLVLARTSTRQKEIGVRLAIGAGWWRIARLLLVENLAMGLAAAALGAVLAIWGTSALRAAPSLITTQFPVRFQTSIDLMGLAFAAALGIACAVIFGAAPALQMARVDPHAVLRTGIGQPSRGSMRRWLMAIEASLATAVLIAAGLFLQSFRQTQSTDPGFRRAGLLLSAYDLTGRDIDSSGSRVFAADLLDRLNALPEVESAGIASSVPLDIHGLPSRSFEVEGRARTDGARDRTLSNVVTPGYFKAMGIPIVSGSDFTSLRDTTSPKQAVVNQEFVRRYIEPRAAIGRQVTVSGDPYVIVGIVRNSLYESFSEAPTPIVYMSYRDRPLRAGEIHLRTKLGDETMLAPVVRRAVRDVDPALPVYNVRTMTQHVDMSLALRKIPARMFLVLGPLVLALAAIGIYAVVAYSVSQRTSEIGVRVALGATASRVVGQIVRESLRVIAAGAALGWMLVVIVHIHLIRGGLDMPVFVGVPALLLGVSTLAAWVPARRASRVDPTTALRAESRRVASLVRSGAARPRACRSLACARGRARERSEPWFVGQPPAGRSPHEPRPLWKIRSTEVVFTRREKQIRRYHYVLNDIQALAAGS
jgi:predicted permease